MEVIQEYECGGAASVGSCASAPLLVRDFVHGDPQRYPEVVAMQTYTIYFPNPEDPPVSVPSAAYHYLHDVLGSVIGLVNDAGELVEQYTYDPYGKVFIEKWDAAANGGNGEWAASETDCGSSTCGKLPVSSVGNPFLWTGHRYDAAVGLYATHYRTYSPTLGRWLQRDPLEYFDGLNLYQYVGGAVLKHVDPMGLTSLCAWLRQQLDSLGDEMRIAREWGACYLYCTVKGIGKDMPRKPTKKKKHPTPGACMEPRNETFDIEACADECMRTRFGANNITLAGGTTSEGDTFITKEGANRSWISVRMTNAHEAGHRRVRREERRQGRRGRGEGSGLGNSPLYGTEETIQRHLDMQNAIQAQTALTELMHLLGCGGP